jgi:HSP20 family protein
MLARWNSLDREFDNLFRNFVFRDVALPRPAFQDQAIAAPADVIETETGFEVKVDLPGHDPKSIDVKLENETLTLTSERRPEARTEKDTWLHAGRPTGTFTRSFTLPSSVDASKVEARYENGVLTVFLPKREEAKPKMIQVKVG